MVTVVLKQGDSVRVEVAVGDGSFEIAYTDRELTVTAEFAGSHVGSAGLIHREVFAGCTCAEVPVKPDEQCPEHGNFSSLTVGPIGERTGILVP